MAGNSGRDHNRLPRGGLPFWEAGNRAPKRKKPPGPEVGDEPGIGSCVFLKKKIRPVSKSTFANEPVMTQLVMSRMVGLMRGLSS